MRSVRRTTRSANEDCSSVGAGCLHSTHITPDLRRISVGNKPIWGTNGHEDDTFSWPFLSQEAVREDRLKAFHRLFARHLDLQIQQHSTFSWLWIYREPVSGCVPLHRSLANTDPYPRTGMAGGGLPIFRRRKFAELHLSLEPLYAALLKYSARVPSLAKNASGVDFLISGFF